MKPGREIMTIPVSLNRTRYLNFVLVAVGERTNRWEVWSLSNGMVLGMIRWFGRWRGYVFEPDHGTVFNQECLRDIALFIDEQMKARRKPVEPDLADEPAAPTVRLPSV